MWPIGYFVGLRTLSLAANAIVEMKGLDTLVNLENLWLNENEITRIQGLDNNTKLQKLYLSDNKIQKMENMQNCTALETLYINGNQIEMVENLETLVNLKNLNLAENRIEIIGSAFDFCQSLIDLNLSANCIGNFREVLNFSRLPSITRVFFSDPNYGENPICTLCNYQTYVLYHLSKLSQLDSMDIAEDAKNYAEATFMKKRMYYNMRIKTIQRLVSNLIMAIEDYKNCKVSLVYDEISRIGKELKQVEREINERQKLLAKSEPSSLITFGGSADNELDKMEPDLLRKKLIHKQDYLNEGISETLDHVYRMEQLFQRLKQQIHDASEANIHRLLTELDTGGNIRYEEGKPADNWYVSCVNLAEARFFESSLSPFGFETVSVRRVTRIHNRHLRTRFDDRIRTIADIADIGYKKSFEYLFQGIDPKAPQELFRIMEEGFRSPTDNENQGSPSANILTNSIGLADLMRIKASRSASNRGASFELPSGMILICKVYLGEETVDSLHAEYAPSKSPEEIWEQDQIPREEIRPIYRSLTGEPK